MQNCIVGNEVLPKLKRRKRRVPTENGMKNISYKNLFELYVRECKLKNLSEITIQGYQNSTRYFLDFTGYDLMCDDVTQDLINSYYLYLQNCYKPETVNSYVFKISPTVHYGAEKGYIKEEIHFTHLVEQEKIKEIYTKEELEKLLKRPKGNEWGEFRTWVIINTFLATGIRAKELRDLRIKDVDLEQGYIILNSTKNNMARIIPLPTSLVLIMSEWMRVRNASREDYLFCNIYGEQMGRSSLQGSVKRFSLNRGVKRYGLHLYRHTFITLSIRKGMSPIMLKRITGHKNMKMLERYYAFNPTDLVNIVDKYNPLEDFVPKKKLY